MFGKITPLKMAITALIASLLIIGTLSTCKKTQTQASLKKTSKKIKPSNVIFDLNGVLFTINKQKAIAHLGYFDVLAYTAVGVKSMDDLELTIFDVLDQLKPRFTCYHCAGDYDKDADLIPLHKSRPLPHIMRDWLQGEVTGQEVLAKALPYVDELDAEKYFRSKQEKRLVKRTIEMLFDPEVRCSISKPIKAGVKLVERCKNLGHKVYLMSNMDSEFIILLKNKYPEIFDLFDGIIISGDVKALKPYKDIYTRMLSKYNLDPSTCYLIDDQEENILGARRHGITGILCDYNHYRDVRNELRALKVLPPLKKKTTTPR